MANMDEEAVNTKEARTQSWQTIDGAGAGEPTIVSGGVLLRCHNLKLRRGSKF